MTVGTGGTIQGNHTIHGSFTTGSGTTVAPHNDSTHASTLTVVGKVTLDHNTTLNFNLDAPGTVGSNINDLIAITGDLSLDGTLNVHNLTGFGVGTYTLMTYSGTLLGAGTLHKGTLPTGYNYTISIVSDSGHSDVNLGVASALVSGDTNGDGFVTSLDIDAIYKNFGASASSQWKVDGGSGVVDQGDVTYELNHYFHTSYGDANLDTYTDFTDFQTLLDHWQS
ncbi:MAG: hypothetical protein ABSH20_27110, partial [Tepidisphaeraceae bacterium]